MIIKNEETKSNFFRKTHTSKLPKHIKGNNKGSTNWTQSIGEFVDFQYGDIKGRIQIVGYEPKGQYLYIKYEDKEPFRISTGNFKNCQLGKLLGKITNEFKFDIGTIFKDDKRDLIIIDRKTTLANNRKIKWYKYKCNKCGFECGEHYSLKDKKYKDALFIVEGDLIDGCGCSCCCPNPRIVIKGINDIPTTAPWMIKYFRGGCNEAKQYTKASRSKIHPICPDCGRIKDKAISIDTINRKKSIGCICSDGQSYPNKFGFSLLEQLGIEFMNEYSPKWISPKRYDFYFELDNKKYIVEMDGKFHITDNKMNSKTAKDSKRDDDYKDLRAVEHGIEVIRIDCKESESEYIKLNILKSQLNKLFNLSNVDFNKCEEFALKNLVKVACEYKKNNSSLTCEEISKIMNISVSTTRCYLKNGTKLEWCNYNPEKEKLNVGIKNGRKVEMFKDGASLGVFNSCAEIERVSENLFSVKLNGSGISAVCLEKTPIYKGYFFKYV